MASLHRDVAAQGSHRRPEDQVPGGYCSFPSYQALLMGDPALGAAGGRSVVTGSLGGDPGQTAHQAGRGQGSTVIQSLG